MSASLISACNEALGKCAKGSVVSLDERSPEAQECARLVDALLLEIGDWAEWWFMVEQVNLALLATNPREAEWLYAYGVPADMADPLSIHEQADAAIDLPTAGPYPFPLTASVPLRFLLEGGVIYTNVENAALRYTRSDMRAGDMEPLVRRAFVDELAYRLSWPFKLDRGKRGDLKNEAETSRARAIADAENKRQNATVPYVTDAEFAREGYFG